MEAITVVNLKKSYQEHQVLKGISFGVQQGEIFALLGKNGAGKTTTLECIEGLRAYEEGSITIQGSCGVQLQSTSLPASMKAKEALQFFAKWQNAAVDAAYLERIGVTPFLNKQYHQLSTGQKRRLHLAIAMLNDPDILFLDEPTAGLDVEGRAALHEEIRRLKQQGKTIIIASHDMAEVEELCDRIAVMKDGSILYLGSTAELNQQHQEGFLLQIRFTSPITMEALQTCELQETKDTYQCFKTNRLNDTLLELVTLASQQKNEIIDILVEQSSLEQRFLSILKEE